MSKIGKKNIIIPKESSVKIEGSSLTITGPKGSKQLTINDKIFSTKLNENNEFQISNHLGYDLDKSNKLEINFTDDIQIVKNFFTQNSNELNVVICRHVLEHLDNTSIFFDLLPTNINFLILIEVPNGYQMLSHRNRFEDLIYEHVTYFSKISLIKLIENFNYKILDNYTVLNNENLVTLAYKGNNKILEKIISNDINFLNSSFSIINHKYKKLANYLINEKVCFWGISGRCFSILTNSSNFVKDKSMLKCQLADSDVRKVGKKIPDFKNLVKSTNEINFKKIDLIIIGTKVGYNSICEEIKRNGYSNNISIWDNLT